MSHSSACWHLAYSKYQLPADDGQGAACKLQLEIVVHDNDVQEDADPSTVDGAPQQRRGDLLETCCQWDGLSRVSSGSACPVYELGLTG